MKTPSENELEGSPPSFSPRTRESERKSKICQIYKLLGNDVVLLPIPSGKKGPVLRGWQTLTVDQTNVAEFRSKLENHGNTGVLLGKASGDLCSIDIDSDDDLEAFLELNPWLRRTMLTKGERGGNLWVRIEDEYPSLTRLKRGGKAWGEWRADGGQTVVSGKHPSGCRYEIINETQPLQCRWEEIHWPKGVGEAFPPEYSSTLSTSSSQSTSSIAQARSNGRANAETGPGMGHKAVDALERRREIEEKDPDLIKLYRRYVENRFEPIRGERNSAMVAMVAFLAHAVSPDRVVDLSLAFYDLNAPIWRDSREQHLRETKSQLKAVLRSFSSSLSVLEKEIYEALDDRGRSAARVCRSLSESESDPDFPPPSFFLSCGDLRLRLGIHNNEAHRLLSQFKSLGILRIKKKGTRHAKGSSGKATVWEWILSESATRAYRPAER